MATIYDKASLVMIPSGVKDGKAYSIKPTDGSGDFTFSRGTDTATRVNASGLIEKERGNLSINSQNGSAWGSSGVTIDSTTAADFLGGNDAVTITATGGGAAYVYADDNISVVSGVVYTGSVYVKNVDADYVQLTFATSAFGSAQYRNFDLTNGTLGGGLGIDAKIVDVGGGWYRLSITAVATASVSTASLVVLVSPSASASRIQAATAGQTLTAFAIQLESGLVATDYIETTTAAVYEGITDNLPRLDYSGGASCPSLLLEPSRTNLVTQSEVFNIDSAWFSSGRPVVETNVTTSPEGLLNGSRLTFAATHTLRYAPELTFTNGYSYSIFVKKDIGRYVTISALFFTTSATIGFDLDEGTCQAGGVIEPYGDGWYRISVSKSVAGDADKSGYFYLYSTDTLGGTSSTSGNQLYVYGAQIEEGSYPTSYIPTYGTSASRADDDCSKTGVADLIGSTEGTIFLEGAYNRAASGNNVFFELINSPNQLVLYMDSGTNELKLYNSENPTNRLTLSSGDNRGVNHKIAIAYKDNDFAVYRDGVAQSVTGTNLAPTGMANIYVGQNRTGGEVGQSVFKQILLFKTRLTNAELAALTA